MLFFVLQLVVMSALIFITVVGGCITLCDVIEIVKEVKEEDEKSVYIDM